MTFNSSTQEEVREEILGVVTKRESSVFSRVNQKINREEELRDTKGSKENGEANRLRINGDAVNVSSSEVGGGNSST